MVFKLLILLLIFIFFIALEANANYGRELCGTAGYHCITVKKGDTWAKLWPNPYERDVVQRVNRMNTGLARGMKLAVPKDLQSNIFSLSPFPASVTSTGRKTIIIDLTKFAWGAYDAAGLLIKWGPAVGGMSWCKDVNRPCRTVQGTFTLYEKRGGGCFSTRYPVEKGGAPMPYCMFFYKGYAIHGSRDVPGRNASHGCVRVFTSDAKWLNQEFVAVGNTTVIVRG